MKLIEVGLGPRIMPWRHQNGCHFVSYLAHITGAKCEQNLSNISRDILHFVIQYIFVLRRFVTSSVFERKREYLWNERRYFRKENSIIRHFERLFKKIDIYISFLLHRHFNATVAANLALIRAQSTLNNHALFY